MPDTLSIGSRGQVVAELQRQLAEVGMGDYLLPFGIDGSFGTRTELAVRAWQNRHGFKETMVNSPTKVEKGGRSEFLGGQLYAFPSSLVPSSYSGYVQVLVIDVSEDSANPYQLQSLSDFRVIGWARRHMVAPLVYRMASIRTWNSLREALNLGLPRIEPVNVSFSFP